MSGRIAPPSLRVRAYGFGTGANNAKQPLGECKYQIGHLGAGSSAPIRFRDLRKTTDGSLWIPLTMELSDAKVTAIVDGSSALPI